MKKCKTCNKDVPTKRIYCSNKCKFADKNYNTSRSVKAVTNDKKINCVCKKTNKLFKDYCNISGVLTRHVKNEYNLTYSNDQFDSFFIRQSAVDLPLFNCPYCKFTTIDLQNKSGIFTRHLRDHHNKTISEFLLEFPKYKTTFGQLAQLQELRTEHLNNSSKHQVVCQICDEPMKILSNSHLKTHDISQFDYKHKFGPITSEVSHIQFSQNIAAAAEK